ncbi:M48 family metalloprotease [Halosimplex sp. TS25]|uniref:M48 family metalloprotease n=1 Tax=Halosimplex rarum TaxID=3396619 RepID=UPI0039EC04E0
MPALHPDPPSAASAQATILQSGAIGGFDDAVASLSALAVVALAAGLALFAYSRRFRDADDETAALTRIRRALRISLPLAYVVALVAMVAAGWLDAVDAAVGALPGGDSTVGGALTLVTGLTAPLAAVAGGYFGAFPAIRELRTVDVSAATVATRLARYAAGMVAMLAAVVVVVSILGEGLATGAGFFGVIAALLILAWAGSPWLIRLTQSTRAPTDAERERLDRLCADVGLDPRGVRVLEVADAKQAFAFVRGPPGRRHIFVTDYLLTELDDERLRGYLALQAGRARVMHLEARLAVVVGAIALAGALVAGLVSVPGVSDGVAALCVLTAGAVGLWAGTRLVYRADADAAGRTSSEAVESAIRRFADLNDAPMEWGRLATLRRMEPPLARRIDRLRDRASRE